MSMLRSILDRFRPAPAPGRPGPIGVPSETPLTCADELAPVFAALDDVEAQCAAIRAVAAAKADEIARGTAQRIAQIEADGARLAEEARSTAATQIHEHARADQSRELAAAAREADRIYTEGLARLTPYVDAAVAKVRSLATPPKQGSSPKQGASA